MPLAVWRRVFREHASPIFGEAVDDCWSAAGDHSALALAQAVKESSLGKAHNARASKNALGLMVPGSEPSRLMPFATWADGFAEFRRRVTDSAYGGGVYGPEKLPLEGMIVTYVGGPRCWSSNGEVCANGETWEPYGGPDAGSINLYLHQTIDRINRWRGDAPGSAPAPPGRAQRPPAGFQAVTVAGADVPVWLPAGVAFEVALTTHPRTGGQGPMVPRSTTYHETGNRRLGADAGMHSHWQDAGTPGHPDGYVAVHFYVDDRRIIQKIAVNQRGIHSGDGRNATSIAVEQCVNADADIGRARENAMGLHAGLLHAVVERSAEAAMWPHTPRHCPALINARGLWPEVEAGVDALIAGLGAVPPDLGPRFRNLRVPDDIFLRLWPADIPPDDDGPFTRYVVDELHRRGTFGEVRWMHDASDGNRYLLVGDVLLRYDPATGEVEEV